MPSWELLEQISVVILTLFLSEETERKPGEWQLKRNHYMTAAYFSSSNAYFSFPNYIKVGVFPFDDIIILSFPSSSGAISFGESSCQVVNLARNIHV